MSALWEIRCFVSEYGRNEILKWYDCQSNTVKAAFDSALEYLIEQPRAGWIRPSSSRLTGSACADIYEIRIRADNKQIRPLGFFGPLEGSEFTILLCALEKGNEFVPPDACDQATKRKKKVCNDREKFSIKCFCEEASCLCRDCRSPCCQIK